MFSSHGAATRNAPRASTLLAEAGLAALSLVCSLMLRSTVLGPLCLKHIRVGHRALIPQFACEVLADKVRLLGFKIAVRGRCHFSTLAALRLAFHVSTSSRRELIIPPASGNPMLLHLLSPHEHPSTSNGVTDSISPSLARTTSREGRLHSANARATFTASGFFPYGPRTMPSIATTSHSSASPCNTSKTLTSAVAFIPRSLAEMGRKLAASMIERVVGIEYFHIEAMHYFDRKHKLPLKVPASVACNAAQLVA